MSENGRALLKLPLDCFLLFWNVVIAVIFGRWGWNMSHICVVMKRRSSWTCTMGLAFPASYFQGLWPMCVMWPPGGTVSPHETSGGCTFLHLGPRRQTLIAALKSFIWSIKSHLCQLNSRIIQYKLQRFIQTVYRCHQAWQTKALIWFRLLGVERIHTRQSARCILTWRRSLSLRDLGGWRLLWPAVMGLYGGRDAHPSWDLCPHEVHDMQ